MPASLRWTVGATAGWTVSLAGAAAARGATGPGAVRVVLLVAVAVAALAAMRSAAGAFAALLTPMFETPEAPTRAALVGSIGRVRSLEVSPAHGDAKLTTGPSAGAIVPVRSGSTRFAQGDLVQLIAYDEDTGTYTVSDVDALIAPDDVTTASRPPTGGRPTPPDHRGARAARPTLSTRRPGAPTPTDVIPCRRSSSSSSSSP